MKGTRAGVPDERPWDEVGSSRRVVRSMHMFRCGARERRTGSDSRCARLQVHHCRGCCIFRLCRPGNSEFLVRLIPVGGSSGRYQEVIAGDNDALDVSNGSGRAVGLSLLVMYNAGFGMEKRPRVGRSIRCRSAI